MQFFQRKFAVTSVMKIYTKMSELGVHPYYDHLYNPLTSLPFSKQDSGQDSGVEIWTLDATRGISRKNYPCYFTEESVVQCDVPVVKILF